MAVRPVAGGKTVWTALLNAKVDPDRDRYIVGHAGKDIDARHYLEHEIAELVEAIGGLSDPTQEAEAEKAAA